MAQIQHRVFSSIRDIPRDQWDAVWTPVAEGYDFYLSQEDAGIKGFEFMYLALYAAGTLVLAAPLFTAHFNMGLAMDDAGRRRLAKLQRFWPRLLIFKTLFCGSPTSEKGLVGIHPGFRQDADLFQALDRALLDLARKHGAWMIVFKDFMDPDLEALVALKRRGYFTGDGLPTARLRIGFKSMDEYIKGLGAGTRKDLRRKIRKTGKSGRIQVEAVGDIGHCIDEAFQLYMNVYHSGPLHFEVLTKEYFLNFCRHMPGETVYFLYWLKDESGTRRRLVGFNFCLQLEDRLIDKYLGLDYSVSRDLNLYFISLLNNVQWCIDHRKQDYMLSQGCYPVKITLGAQLIPMKTMTRIVNPMANWIANRLA